MPINYRRLYMDARHVAIHSQFIIHQAVVLLVWSIHCSHSYQWSWSNLPVHSRALNRKSSHADYISVTGYTWGGRSDHLKYSQWLQCSQRDCLSFSISRGRHERHSTGNWNPVEISFDCNSVPCLQITIVCNKPFMYAKQKEISIEFGLW